MKKKIVGFVQARMSSTRLPGKVMMEIEGKPMVWHIYHRMKHAKLLDEVVFVISTNPNDRPMAEMAEKENLPYYAGEEADLLNRYKGAAEKFSADLIVRVTADCPLADPQLADEMISAYQNSAEPLDYISNSRPKATYPHGLDLELFTRGALEKAWREITDSFRREWLTTNFFEHPETYRTKNITGTRDLSMFRLTVDYQEDLDLIRAVYKGLYKNGRIFKLDEVINFLEENPQIAAMNRVHYKDDSYLKELAKRGVS